MLRAGIVQELRRLVGSEVILTDEAARVAAGTDFITRRGVAGAVARPTSAEQVAEVVGFAAGKGVSVVPRGGATNLAAAIKPNEESLVLDLTSMSGLEVDAVSRCAVVEPGVINADLKARVAREGLVYAPDPASTPISTIGGNIAENAGGPGCIKHGVTFHHVLWLEVVLGDGRVATFDRGDPIDLLGVLIGSEGTLGVITRAGLNLLPAPAARWTALAAFDRAEDAAGTVAEIIAAGILPAALEICDQRAVELCEAHLPSGYPTGKAAILFAELDGDADEVAGDAEALERVLRDADPNLLTATTDHQRAALWAGRLAAMHAFKASGKDVFVCDATVPPQRLPEMITRGRQIAAAHDLDVATVGHAGDGNLHPIMLYRPEELDAVDAAASEIAEAAMDLGGTLTGEHGIGTAKLAQMHRRFGPTELATFRAIKHACDPAGVLNPGVLLPPETAEEPELPTFARAVHEALAGRAPSAPNAHPNRPSTEAVTVDAANMTITADGAASCRNVAAAVDRAGLSCPAVDNDGCVADTIERTGNRSTVRPLLLGITATLPDGQQAKFGSAAIKDVAGLDAKRLIAGGHGAFGWVEQATFRTLPQSRSARRSSTQTV